MSTASVLQQSSPGIIFTRSPSLLFVVLLPLAQQEEEAIETLHSDLNPCFHSHKGQRNSKVLAHAKKSPVMVCINIASLK